MYREGRYVEALGFYTDALSLAKTKSQKIALHSNRAACFLKLHDFKKVTSLSSISDFAGIYSVVVTNACSFSE